MLISHHCTPENPHAKLNNLQVDIKKQQSQRSRRISIFVRKNDLSFAHLRRQLQRFISKRANTFLHTCVHIRLIHPVDQRCEKVKATLYLRTSSTKRSMRWISPVRRRIHVRRFVGLRPVYTQEVPPLHSFTLFMARGAESRLSSHCRHFNTVILWNYDRLESSWIISCFRGVGAALIQLIKRT